MDLKNINTVGVIMFGLLGDVLMRTPVLRALKKFIQIVELLLFVILWRLVY